MRENAAVVGIHHHLLLKTFIGGNYCRLLIISESCAS